MVTLRVSLACGHSLVRVVHDLDVENGLRMYRAYQTSYQRLICGECEYFTASLVTGVRVDDTPEAPHLIEGL